MRRQANAAAWLLLNAVLAACGPDPTAANDRAGGGSTAMAGGGGASGAGVGGGATAGSDVGPSGAGTAGGQAGGSADACPEGRQLLPSAASQLELLFEPTLAGKPFTFGEPNPMTGGQLTPGNVRFYVSELSLLAADGSSVAVELVTPAGQPEPYGVHLVNWEEPESMRVRALAPAGGYTGARFTVGLNDACNSGGSNRSAPLSFNSQMVWPHFAGFLFLRYEAQWTADATAEVPAPAPPTMIHMGGLVGSVFAPQATVPFAFTVPATGTVTRTVQVSFDEIFRGASSSEDTSNIPFTMPEIVAGERLRRAVPTLPIFTVAEP